MSLHAGSQFLTVLTTGNPELDNRLGGGIPAPSLLIIEGDNGTGKTALCCQLTHGFIFNERKVMYVITENSIRVFLEQARSISYDLITPYVKGALTIIPAHLEGVRWSKKGVNELINALVEFLKVRSKDYDVAIIDSISMLVRYMSVSNIHNFITELRQLVKAGKLVVITIHSGMLTEEAMKVFIADSDVYFRLSLAEIGGRAVKVINVVKIRGAPLPAESAIAFDVDPAFGIKIVPLALAKA